jgi:hypothetical protein
MSIKYGEKILYFSKFSPIRSSVVKSSVLFEVQSFEVGLFEVGSFEVGSFEVGSFEVGSFEVQSYEVRSFEVQSFEVQSVNHTHMLSFRLINIKNDHFFIKLVNSKHKRMLGIDSPSSVTDNCTIC